MDVHPPLDCPPLSPSEYPQPPTRTPLTTLERVRAAFDDGDIRKFRDELDSVSPEDLTGVLVFDICDLYPIMVEAINQDDTRFIKELLDRGLPMDPSYALQAVRAKAKGAFDVFITSGWDINQPLSDLRLGPPILSEAIEDEEMLLTWLLNHGADPNKRCLIDLTPLSLAVKSAPISIISLLFNHGGDARKGQLLHHTIERKSDIIKVLKLLLDKGASIDSTASEDQASWALFQFMGLGTALHKAAEAGRVDVVRFLIREGADLSIKDANGRMPVECARILGQWEVVEVLDKGG